MLCHQPKGHLLAPAADEDRHRSGRPGLQLLDALLDAWQRLLEGAQPVSRFSEREPVLVVIALEPSCSEAEHEPAARQLIDGARLIGDEIRISISDRTDHGADLGSFGVDRRGRQQRPALELVAVGVAVEWKEVIPEPDAVHAKLVGPAPRVAQLRDRALLRMNRDPDFEALRFGHWSGIILSLS